MLHFFILLQVNIIIVIADPTTNNYFDISTCSNSSSSLPKNQKLPSFGSILPKCTIESSHTLKGECIGNYSSSVWTSWESNYTEIKCVSSRPIKVQITFSEYVPSWSIFPSMWLFDSYVHSRRLEETDPNIPTQFHTSYILRITTQFQIRTKYEICHEEDPGVCISIIVCFLLELEDLQAVWLTKESTFEAIDELVNIPCLLERASNSSDPNKDNVFNIVEHSGKMKPIMVDNKSLSYNRMNGFFMNTTSFVNYTHNLFRCKGDRNKYWDFKIHDAADLKVKPEKPRDEEIIRLFATRYVNRVPIKVECNYIEQVRLSGYMMTNFVNDSGRIYYFYLDQQDHTSKRVEMELLNQTRYTTQQRKKFRHVASWEYNLQVFNQLEVNCTRESDGFLLNTWVVYVDDIASSPYLNIQPIINTAWGREEFPGMFGCFSEVYSDITLGTIRCNNIFQCRTLEHCLSDRDHICEDIVEESSRCQNILNRWKASCKQVPVLAPGAVTMCYGRGHSYKMIHFVGFDKFIYDSNEESFPTTAIMNLQIEAGGLEFYTNLTFRMNCTAHQFFSEGKFKWNVASEDYINENVAYEIGMSSIFGNTSKPRSLLLRNCSDSYNAGRDWIGENVTIHIQESIPPEILFDNNRFEFEKGKSNQGIECKATGTPIPKIIWNRTDLEFQDSGSPFELDVRDLAPDIKLLRFSKFGKSHEGIYTCTASNSGGNKSVPFIVTLKKDPRLSIAFLTIVQSLAFMLIPLALSIVLYRMIKPPITKRNETELEIFHEGNPNTAAEPSADGFLDAAIHKPFNSKYEVPAGDIKIDKTKFLDEGEFGEVFEGTVNGRRVAVKMIKKNSPDDVFEVLKKEVKIMTSLGQHEHIVQVVATCTENNDIGKLLLALELCENGSLVKYLISNRGFYDRGDRSSDALESHYEERDYKFGFQELLRWAEEVAKGMEYLGSINVFIKDLISEISYDPIVES